MVTKLSSTIFTWLILSTVLLLYLYSSILPFYSKNEIHKPPLCNLFKGRWVQDLNHKPLYDQTCPFHRNSWNCLRNQRDNMDRINSWKWVPKDCSLPRIDPFKFLETMRDKSVGFIGDSLNENFLVSFLCVLRVADNGARKWKRKGAWRGGYFPKFNVTVAYHRAVLLAKYQWQPAKAVNFPGHDEAKGVYRVDVDVPADDWIGVTNFYNVLVFNTGHWWGADKFPKEKPLVFYRKGQAILPPLELSDGLKVVLENIVSFIRREVPHETLKLWRMQSPRHFYGGEWNQNGSCLFNGPLEEEQLETWFDPSNPGVNKEARQVNHLIAEAIRDTDIQLLDVTHLSEFRADAHPAIWLGKKDAVAIWGQDCMHWCLPGVPDTWVDILSAIIHNKLESG